MSERWVFRVLGALVLALVAASAFVQLQRAGKGGGSRATQELTMLAKMALVGSALPGTAAAAYEDPLLAKLDQAAASPSAGEQARALRRKAIWCSFRELGCAPAALDALDRIPAEDRRPAPADEVAVLRESLSGAPISPERAAALDARLPEIRLGWFDRLLRAQLYRHAGDAARADAEVRAATRSAMVALGAMLGFTALLGAGVIAWMILLVAPARSRILARIAEGLRERGEARPGDSARQLAVVAVFFAASLVIPLAAGTLGLGGDDDPVARAGWTLALEVVLLVVVGIAHFVFARPAGVEMGFRPVSPLRALGAGALAYLLLWPVLVLVLLPLGALFERLGLPTRSHPIVDQLQGASGSPAAFALWLVIAAVLAPLLEEAVFRGSLHGAVAGRFGGRAALLAVAALFAIIHPQIGLGLVGVFLVGIALSLVRIHERSLWPGVVLHAINNGVALLLATALLSG